MVQLSDRALILRRVAYGESSLVLQVLTREHGRVHLIAKGAYRPKSRYFAVLDLFDTLELGWSDTRGRELQNLHSASIFTRRARIAQGLAGFRAALSVLELAAAAAQEARAEHALFDALERALDGLLEARLPTALVQVEFELGLLHNLGLAPALGHCAACGREAPPSADEARVLGAVPRGRRAAFSAGAGGRLCRGCAEEARAAGRRVGTLPLDVLEFARRILDTDEAHATRGETLEDLLPSCDAEGLERVRDFVARFLEFHLEARPKSFRGFLASENRNAARA